MAPSSSGGSTVGEALNILEGCDLAGMDDAAALHHYLEASALAFADRGAYVGDPAYVDVPLRDLLSQKYADERACLLDPEHGATKPVAAGDVTSYDGECDAPAGEGAAAPDTEGSSTTHLTAADRWGNVVAYTLTIEQTGGSGIVVPGRGFLLNNELTDFSAVFDEADPNRIQPGKRPRSSMSPTIVLRDGRPFLALGSPGGSTIITTVLQVLLNRIDLGMTIPEAIAAPRAAQRNTADGHGGAGVHRRLRRAAGAVRPRPRAGGSTGQQRVRDRRGGGDRVPDGRDLDRGGRARSARWRLGPGGAAEVARAVPWRGDADRTPAAGYAEITTLEELVELLGEPAQRAVDKERTALLDVDRDWLAASPFCVLATTDADGNAATPRPRATRPGSLVHVIDERTIAIAERPGNRRADGYHNILPTRTSD